MKAIESKIPGVVIIETDVFADYRGYFTETYKKPKYEAFGITTEFVQDSMSFSAQKVPCVVSIGRIRIMLRQSWFPAQRER